VIIIHSFTVNRSKTRFFLGFPEKKIRKEKDFFTAEFRSFPADFLALSRIFWWPSSFLISWHQELGFALSQVVAWPAPHFKTHSN
jgi:hypothetical protein